MRDDKSRIQSVDFLRGLALTIVMLDHIDLLTGNTGIFRSFTPIGMGYSDASEVFVFLAGFSFGWRYRFKIAQDGLIFCQWRILLRSLNIYIFYIILIFSIGFIEISTGCSPINSTMLTADRHAARDALLGSLSLTYQPTATGILCTCIVVSQLLPIAIIATQKSQALTLTASFIVYVLLSLYSRGNFLDYGGTEWFFSPFAWQFIMIVGVVCGYRTRDSRKCAPKHIILILLSICMVIIGFLHKRECLHKLFFNENISVPIGTIDTMTSKTYLGPLRLLHFFAVAYLVTQILPKRNSTWNCFATKLFIICGRHSLPVYCVGTIISYTHKAFLPQTGSWLLILMFSVFACLIQFSFAIIIDYRKT